MSEDLKLEDFLPYRLSVLSNTVSTTVARAYDKRFKVSIPEWRVIAILGRFPGLSAVEVERRRRRYGPNELDDEPPIHAWRRFVAQFRDPLVYLLLAAIVVSLLAWSLDGAHEAPIEALVIAAIVIANAVLGYWQERRAVAAVAALQQMAATRSHVRRDGEVVAVANS